VLLLILTTSATTTTEPDVNAANTNRFTIAVGEAIKKGQEGWPDLVKNYEDFVKEAAVKNTAGLQLTVLQSSIKNATSGDVPIDAYSFGWTWHPSFRKCQEDFNDVKEKTLQDLIGKPEITVPFLKDHLAKRRCIDVRPENEKISGLLEPIIDRLNADDGTKSLAPSISRIVDQIFNSSSKPPQVS
jgi:hypothetical protein